MKVSKFRIFFIIFTILVGVYLSVPSLLPQKYIDKIPEFLKAEPVALGLDLKGGAYILLEADVDTVVKDKVAKLKDLIRKELRSDRDKNTKTIPYSNLITTSQFASVVIRDKDLVKDAVKRLKVATDNEMEIQVVGNTIKMFYNGDAVKKIKDDVLTRSIEIVRRRIDSLGNKEPSIQRQGDNRIMVQLPGVDNPERIKQLLGKTAKMTFHMVSEESMKTGQVAIDEKVIDGVIIKKKISVSGENLTDSKVVYDQNGNPAVTTTFDSIGGREFSRLTADNIGKRFAIVLDDKVLSAPVIQEVITGGHGQITGGFSIEEAKDLSTMLRSGALPCQMMVVEERTVGAGLGADSIRKGGFASILGFSLVLLFMFLTYGKLGLFADVTLILNVVFIFAGLQLSGATLTLPGIAGIALNIGMAVDANILVFERMRELVALGVPTVRVVDEGFKNALSSIIDSNITTLASAFVLFQFGSGSVKGFAITLTIGILTSFFTNITCLKTFLTLWASKKKTEKIDI